jgi:hypothetical protein
MMLRVVHATAAGLEGVQMLNRTAIIPQGVGKQSIAPLTGSRSVHRIVARSAKRPLPCTATGDQDDNSMGGRRHSTCG